MPSRIEYCPSSDQWHDATEGTSVTLPRTFTWSMAIFRGRRVRDTHRGRLVQPSPAVLEPVGNIAPAKAEEPETACQRISASRPAGVRL